MLYRMDFRWNFLHRNTAYFLLQKLILLGVLVAIVNCQYEDVRCKCICPVPSVVSNSTNGTTRRLYIKNVLPNQCNCDFVVLPQLTSDVQSKAKEFCPRCECKYESRDTSIIRFFVIFIIGVISFLVVYMIFLMILDPWIHKRSSLNSYKCFNEEVSLEEPNQSGEISEDPNSKHQMSSLQSPEASPRASGVLNRVGHSQTKWKRQVKEQRKNIFDNHTILN
ncbi:Transmembrane protein 9 [Sarcoptes scabiei]|uniref:Transmembrane protein 9 n=1 Tax=Sarcoptes scabiei TaxID=52283 RepID=A0A834REN0_SARSC|nr:Transmembrane protein 9 [Sarcoptes scabiei]